MTYIDSHSHIDFTNFDEDRHEVLERAKQKGVDHIIVSAITANRWQVLKDTVKNEPRCHPAYGLHPMFMKEHKAAHLDDLKFWLEKENPVAVGEIGLDFFIPDPEKDRQLRYFIAQLELASEFNLPVIIHSRKSLDLVLKQIRKMPGLRGSIHSFSGSEQQAKQLVELGFYLGFGGPITYTRATRLRNLVATLPLESILLETDSPDQPDATHHGERNEPAYLPLVAEAVAELRGIRVSEVARITSNNARTLFKLE